MQGRRRWIRSHGPATIRDFVWWSGLPTSDARQALEMVKGRREEVDGLTYWTVGATRRGGGRDHRAHLLPIYDEYLVAYRDRIAVPHLVRKATSDAQQFVPFQHALVIDGQVAGTWRLVRGARAGALTVYPSRTLTRPEQRAVDEALTRYERFCATE